MSDWGDAGGGGDDEPLEIQISNGFFLAEDEMRAQPAAALAGFLDVAAKAARLLADADAVAAMDRDSLKEVQQCRVKALANAAALQLRTTPCSAPAVAACLATLKQLLALLDARADGRADLDATLSKVATEAYGLATAAAAVLVAAEKAAAATPASPPTPTEPAAKAQKVDGKADAKSSAAPLLAALGPQPASTAAAPTAAAVAAATNEYGWAEEVYTFLVAHCEAGAKDKTHIHNLTYEASWFSLATELAGVYLKRRAFAKCNAVVSALLATLPPPPTGAAAAGAAATASASSSASSSAAGKDEKAGGSAAHPKPIAKNYTEQYVTLFALQLRAARLSGDAKARDAVVDAVAGLLAAQQQTPGKRPSASSGVDAKSMALLRHAVGARHLGAGRFAEAQKMLFGAFASAQHTALERRTVRTLVYLVVAQLLAGHTVNPFHARQTKVYTTKYREARALSDLMLALEQRSDKLYAETLAAHKHWLAALPLVAPHWAALTAVKPPPIDLSTAVVSFKSVDKKLYENDTCCICCEDLRDASTAVVRLSRCTGHYFHRDCIEPYVKQSKKCPMCGTFYGIATGTQPDGHMRVTRNGSQRLPGHAACGTIVLSFEFPGGKQGPEHPHPGKAYHGDSRVAYLPDNDEGNQILRMFEVGWERKQLFKIGYSETRNVDDVICYNGVHMKSSPSGTHGYPDPTYFKRLKEEFASKGIFEDAVPSSAAAAAKK